MRRISLRILNKYLPWSGNQIDNCAKQETNYKFPRVLTRVYYTYLHNTSGTLLFTGSVSKIRRYRTIHRVSVTVLYTVWYVESSFIQAKKPPNKSHSAVPQTESVTLGRKPKFIHEINKNFSETGYSARALCNYLFSLKCSKGMRRM